MVSKNCMSCPSLSPANDATFFRKTIGAPVCKRYGKPIGNMNSTDEQKLAIGEAIAASCGDHGKPAPDIVDWGSASFQVTFPGGPEAQEKPESVTSCLACKHYIKPEVVAEEFGWNAGLCAQKGKLILANRTTLEARKCEFRSLGAPVAQPAHLASRNLVFLPEYQEGFGVVTHVTQAMEQIKDSTDPAEYETDMPVSEADADRIRAWRRIKDVETGNEIFLPIYKPEFFAKEQQELIPQTGDDEHPEDYVDHAGLTYKVGVLWMHLDETPAFWGKAGTGKTEFFRYMAWLMQLPFYRFSITGSTELDDLAGKMQYTEGVGTHFQKGRLVKAWESPCVMVVDEPNAGPPDVWQFLRPMTDNSKQLVLDQSDGERSTRDDDCFLGMAMNPAWDLLNVGTNMLGDADANRLMHIYIELPDPELEREIIKKRCAHDDYELPTDKLDLVMKIAKDIRALADDGTLQITWAIRPQLKVARALRWFDIRTAYRMASGDYLEPAQQAALMDIVNTHVE